MSQNFIEGHIYFHSAYFYLSEEAEYFHHKCTLKVQNVGFKGNLGAEMEYKIS